MALYRLFRLPLTIANAVLAVAGASLYSGFSVSNILPGIFFGVALLAAGASAVNQVLEQEQDSRMMRTAHRPVPAGMVTSLQGTATGIVMIALGAFLLVAVGGVFSSLLGVGSVLWYLLVYTPLKQRTPCALLAGALCGAVTPLVGWCSVGGELFDYRIMVTSGIIYIWQVPHFWLFQQRHADDFRAAGFKLLNLRSGSRLFLIWITALVTATMLLPVIGVVTQTVAAFSMIFSLATLVIIMLRLEKMYYSCLNLFPLMISLECFLSNI